MCTFQSLAQATSSLCGWLYVLLWSLSFYSQPLLNIRRHSTEGLAFDWPFLNVYGSACYTICSALFLYSQTVKREFADRNPTSPFPTTRFNDLCFGVHSLVVCTITVTQFWPDLWYWKGASKDRTLSRTTSIVFGGSLFTIVFAICLVLILPRSNQGTLAWNWIDVAYLLGDVKLLVTIVKYIPQVVSNHKRKSTSGLAMSGVLMDMAGGILSLAQLAIDSALRGDWSDMAANPAKLGLANLSMFADIVFMVQYYVFHKMRAQRSLQQLGAIEDRTGTETEPLIPSFNVRPH